MKTVLLLGAGFTRAAAGRRSKSKRPPLDADFFDIARLAHRAESGKLHDYLRQLVGGYSKVLTDSLETATTHLYLKAREAKRRDPAHRGFMRLLALLNQVLTETTYPIKVGPQSLVCRFLRKELGLAGAPGDLTIITFNYDLLVERALAALAPAGGAGIFSFPGCYRLPGKELDEMTSIAGPKIFENVDESHMSVAVLKLHGSLNWHSAHTSRAPLPTEMFRTNREIMITNSPAIPNSLPLKKGGRTVYLQPVIIPPVSGKEHLVHELVGGLWQRAATALQNAERLVIAGYSCPAMDIDARVLISESLRAGKGRLQAVHVINPKMEIADTFAELCGASDVIAYRNLKLFLREAGN